jgi:hypothetical protein
VCAAHAAKRSASASSRRARLVRHPLEHALRECELVERAAEELRHLAFQRLAVERCRLVGLDLQHRAALHELALHLEERGEAVMALDQLFPRLLDAEKRRDEPVEVGREGDEELRLFLVGERGRVRPQRGEALVQGGIRLGEPLRERPVDAHEPVAIVEVFEGVAESEGQRGCCGGHCGSRRTKTGNFIGSRGPHRTAARIRYDFRTYHPPCLPKDPP